MIDNAQEISSESDEEWSNNKIQSKRIKISSDDDKVLPKNREQISSRFTIKNNHDTNNDNKKKSYDLSKKTVFDRLGDSSVTSTTNTNDSNTTFNVTGLGDVIKRNNSSVFNRLGDKDAKNELLNTSVLKNGSNNNGTQPQGILKAKVSNLGTTTVKITSPTNSNKIKTGTMHADYEKNKTISPSIKQLVKTTKAIRITTTKPPITVRKNTPINSKLASERTRVVAATAKSRLGLTGSQKQVTFNKVTTVAHIKKPGVFSRLGV